MSNQAEAPKPSATAIDCPACERMGRVTVLTLVGTLTTATCTNCNGLGVIEPHYSEGCRYCAHASAGAQLAEPLFSL